MKKLALITLLLFSGYFAGHGAAYATSSRSVVADTISPSSGNTGVAIGASSANSSALLDLESTSLGFLPPQMTTTQKNAISSPASGLVVYDTTLKSLNIYNGAAWVSAGGSGGIAYAADTGTANAYAIGPTPAALAYSAGSSYVFLAAHANTTSSTLNVSGLGTKAITIPGQGATLAGDILANQIVAVTYDGTQFQMISPQGPATSSNTAGAIIKRDGSGNFSANTITAALSGNATTATTATTATSATTATTATNANNVSVNATVSNSEFYTLGVATVSGGNQSTNSSTGLVHFNPGTGVDSATKFLAGLAGTTQGSVVLNSTGTSNTTTIQPAPSPSPAVIFQLPANNGTTGFPLQTDGTGKTSWTQTSLTAGVTGTLPYANGGTNATSQALAQANMSPQTTKGDVISYTTTPVRHAVPGDGGIIVGDSGQSDGLGNRTYLTRQNGRPGKNYIQYADLENGATTGWTAMGCATLVNGLPTCVGSGGLALSSSNGGRAKNANTNAIAVDSSSAVGGTYALNYATTGAGAIGDGLVSSLYPIDPEDQAKWLNFSIAYKVASGTPVMAGTSANTYAVVAYDPVNNAFLGTTGAFNFVQSTGVGYATGGFQTASNTTSIQLFVYSPIAPTGTSSILIDDFYVGRQYQVSGPAIGDFVAYTPTFVGFGTVSGVNVQSKRDGDSLLIRGTFTSGTATASTASMTLGYNGVSGNVASTSGLPTESVAGGPIIFGSNSGANNYFYVPLIAPSATVINFGGQTTTSAGLTPVTGSTLGSTTTFSFTARIPIVGWSSNTVMSSDSDQRPVAFNVVTSSSTCGTSASLVSWSGASTDSLNAFNGTTTYTIPVTGWYQMSWQGQTAAVNLSTAQRFILSLYVNGSDVVDGSRWIGNGASVVASSGGTIIQKLSAGATITVECVSSVSVALSGFSTDEYFSIQRVGGPAVVAASDSVNAAYSNTAGSTVGTVFTVIPFATKSYDSNNAWNTINANAYTAPIPGKYRISVTALSAVVTLSAAQIFQLEVVQAGSASVTKWLGQTYGNTGNQPYGASGTATFNMAAGDTLQIEESSSVSTTLFASAGFNHFEIERVGN